MGVLLYLVPAALGLGLIGLFGFMWSMRSGQYDDLEGAANRILNDDDLGADAPHPSASVPDSKGG
jgi:cbb3-type cytochrome oxidase maturation protein